jgi:RNA polymerase sigma factor (sigma-70 family)
MTTKEINEKIIENTNLVHWYIRKKIKRIPFGITRRDLFQEGILGLQKAIKKYNPSLSKFSVYALFWIRKEISRHIETNLNIIRWPSHCAISLARRNYEKCPDLKLGEKQVLYPDDHQFFEQLPADENEITTIADIDISNIKNALRKLTKRELIIIKMRFGFGFDTESSLKTVAQELEISRERVRQIQDKALYKIKTYLLANREKRPQKVKIVYRVPTEEQLHLAIKKQLEGKIRNIKTLAKKLIYEHDWNLNEESLIKYLYRFRKRYFTERMTARKRITTKIIPSKTYRLILQFTQNNL